MTRRTELTSEIHPGGTTNENNTDSGRVPTEGTNENSFVGEIPQDSEKTIEQSFTRGLFGIS